MLPPSPMPPLPPPPSCCCCLTIHAGRVSSRPRPRPAIACVVLLGKVACDCEKGGREGREGRWLGKEESGWAGGDLDDACDERRGRGGLKRRGLLTKKLRPVRLPLSGKALIYVWRCLGFVNAWLVYVCFVCCCGVAAFFSMSRVCPPSHNHILNAHTARALSLRPLTQARLTQTLSTSTTQAEKRG